MAFRSSFGLLIQIPFFIAAYVFLSNLSALRGEHFLFIRDMGAEDALFRIGNFPVNVLPIAMTLINIVAGAVYTKASSSMMGLTIRQGPHHSAQKSNTTGFPAFNTPPTPDRR